MKNFKQIRLFVGPSSAAIVKRDGTRIPLESETTFLVDSKGKIQTNWQKNLWQLRDGTAWAAKVFYKGGKLILSVLSAVEGAMDDLFALYTFDRGLFRVAAGGHVVNIRKNHAKENSRARTKPAYVRSRPSGCR